MKVKILVKLFILFLISGLYKNTLAQAPEGYKLVWADEFNSPELNTSDWRYRIGKSGTSYQRPENVSFKNGNLIIHLKKEKFNNMEYTGGGIITKFPVKYGYFEVSTKLDTGYGWHESFWTTWMSGFENNFPEYKTMPRLEIDCFEHYTTHDEHKFSYGAIEWYPLQGDANRDFENVPEDLSQTYNTFGLEFTPDYLNYFYNGRLLKTIDTRELPQHDQYLWLSCIANQPDATPSGTVYFDYIRYYEISKTDYNNRKIPFIKYIDSLKGPQNSSGTDLWIEAEDFISLGTWTKKLDMNNAVLYGVTNKNPSLNENELKASTNIRVKKAGKYYLWVRSRDFSDDPAKRKFKVIINGQTANTNFGTHKQDGYEWEFGGTFDLSLGKLPIELFDAFQYYARVDKLLLTTDPNFIPSGIGGKTNVKHCEYTH